MYLQERPQYQDQIQLRVKHLRRSQLPAYVLKKEECKGESPDFMMSSSSSHSCPNHEEKNGIQQRSPPSSSSCRSVSSRSAPSVASSSSTCTTSSTLISGGSSIRGTGGGEELDEGGSSSSSGGGRGQVKRKVGGADVENERGVEVGEGEKKRMKAHDNYSPVYSEVGSPLKQRARDGETGEEDKEGREGVIIKSGTAPVHIHGGEEPEGTSNRA